MCVTSRLATTKLCLTAVLCSTIVSGMSRALWGANDGLLDPLVGWGGAPKKCLTHLWGMHPGQEPVLYSSMAGLYLRRALGQAASAVLAL